MSNLRIFKCEDCDHSIEIDTSVKHYSVYDAANLVIKAFENHVHGNKTLYHEGEVSEAPQMIVHARYDQMSLLRDLLVRESVTTNE